MHCNVNCIFLASYIIVVKTEEFLLNLSFHFDLLRPQALSSDSLLQCCLDNLAVPILDEVDDHIYCHSIHYHRQTVQLCAAQSAEEESLEASLKPFPDAARFPKNSAGSLFFADCLSSRNKYRDDRV